MQLTFSSSRNRTGGSVVNVFFFELGLFFVDWESVENVFRNQNLHTFFEPEHLDRVIICRMEQRRSTSGPREHPNARLTCGHVHGLFYKNE